MSANCVPGTVFVGASFAKAELGGARFVGATVHWCDLYHVANGSEIDFTDADLTDARLQDAELQRPRLVRANLTRAILTHALIADADLTDAKLNDARFDSCWLAGSIIDGVSAAGARGSVPADATVIRDGQLVNAVEALCAAGADVQPQVVGESDSEHLTNWINAYRLRFARP